MSDALIGVGTAAPDFELDGSDGRSYRLKEILTRHEAFLVFYPGNNTPG